MTLRCECGGVLELDGDPMDHDHGWSEHYECVACGRVGGAHFRDAGRRADYWGCVDDA